VTRHRINQRLAEIQCLVQTAPVLVRPERAKAFLGDILGSLAGKSPEPTLGPPNGYRREVVLRARALLQEDIEQILIHPVNSETAKPFARAEVLTTGKGLLGRVAFVVAGAGFEPATFGYEPEKAGRVRRNRPLTRLPFSLGIPKSGRFLQSLESGIRTCLLPLLQADSQSGGVAPSVSTAGFPDSRGYVAHARAPVVLKANLPSLGRFRGGP
jgi:hypothetical protein